jgi:signal transduction histidine kinase
LVAVQIFAYVDNAMFGIELDFLTSETGHLMGRAIGKVQSGTRELLRGLPAMLALARSAIEDGINRLQLIHNNFYWFSVHRKMLDNTSSTSAGAVNGADQRVDVQSLLGDMMPMFGREAVERGLTPTRFFGARDRKAVIAGPADPLRLTFLNLYDNAVKFAYNDTHVDIRLRIEDGLCVVSFENLGTGVAPDEFVTVFDRLRRSRYQDRSKRTEGLGLGLSYCRRVVQEIFHGQIALISRPAMTTKQRPYEGYNYLTTVTVRLPLAPEGDNAAG